MIDINKKYKTRNGCEVRIYATDGGGKYPIHGAIKNGFGDWCIVGLWSQEGEIRIGYSSENDLIEVSPYEDFKIDDKVLVWAKGSSTKHKRYFAGVSNIGRPLVFVDGKTSWSSEGQTCSYTHCERWCENEQ